MNTPYHLFAAIVGTVPIGMFIGALIAAWRQRGCFDDTVRLDHLQYTDRGLIHNEVYGWAVMGSDGKLVCRGENARDAIDKAMEAVA